MDEKQQVNNVEKQDDLEEGSVKCISEFKREEMKEYYTYYRRGKFLKYSK